MQQISFGSKYFVLVAFFIASFAAQSVTAQVLAKVGNKEITLKEFQERYDSVKRALNPPTPEQFLEDLVRFEVGLQEAQKRHLEKDPAVKQKIEEEMYKGLVERSIGDKVTKIKVTEKEMQGYYKNNPELRTSHILIEIKANASEEDRKIARKRAEEILAEVKSSKRPFEDLVKLYTDDTISKNTGGDVGYQSRVTLVPPYYETALKMKMNEVRGLVETQYGFHIIKLTGRRSYQQANKQQIRAAVYDEKRKQIFNEFFRSLKSKYKISTNKSLLSKVR